MADKFFFPHKLFLKINGVFVEQSECRDQPNNGGDVINTAERTDYKFASLIWIPKKSNQQRYLPGHEVQVIGSEGEKRITGKVARFEFGNLEENRLWI